MGISNSHIYLAVDREIDRCNAWFHSKLSDANSSRLLGVQAELLQTRLMQRLVELLLPAYSALVCARAESASDGFLEPGTLIEGGRAAIRAGTGRIGITFRHWLRNQWDFLLHWAFCFVSIVIVRGRTRAATPTVLVFGVGEDSLFSGNDDRQFLEYCRRGPISVLSSAKRLAIQSDLGRPSSENERVQYSKRPLIDLLREAELGASGRLRLLLSHLVLFLEYQLAVFRLPPVVLLGKDFAYSRISQELARRGLIYAIVQTCSNYMSQPLWLHVAELHMIWYAQNIKPIVYSSDGIEAPIPALRWMRVDVQWVWTHSCAAYFKALGHVGDIRVVGPIVWTIPDVQAPRKDAIAIAAFDMPPFSDEVASRLGHVRNYHRPENLRSFIAGILAVKESLQAHLRLPVVVKLKMKRGYREIYDKAYFDYIEELGASGAICLVHHSANIYSLISSSHLVIAYPFSSPAYIAESLRVPAIYFDPTHSIVNSHLGDTASLIHFADSREALHRTAVELVGGGLVATMQ